MLECKQKYVKSSMRSSVWSSEQQRGRRLQYILEGGAGRSSSSSRQSAVRCVVNQQRSRLTEPLPADFAAERLLLAVDVSADREIHVNINRVLETVSIPITRSFTVQKVKRFAIVPIYERNKNLFRKES